ncbi:hypothetical protein JQ607_04580 [Bradyrhizobium liaoningense]|nr:tripartite tricarboxylate transporter substrate-binding protein [Bradyrhizobium liaoningense]MBR0839463.1 hypothetical protein [Bradyrhizobium liaoningense]
MADEIKQDAGGFRPSRREFGGLVAAAVLLPDPGRAESRRQITAFVPFPAGGSLDSLTRIVTQKIAEQGSEAFVVENRAGANGTLGARAAIQSEPDGRAWLFGHDALLTVNDSLYHKQPGFDAQTEIKVAAALAQSPSMLVVHPAFGPKSIKEFVEYGKQTEIQYASGGIGSA